MISTPTEEMIEPAKAGPRPPYPGFARWRIANLSIKHRLPLLMSVILIGVIVSLTWAAYRAVKQAAFETGGERLKNLTQQLANLTQTSAADLLTKTTTAASDPAVVEFLRSPSGDRRSRASAALRSFLAPQDPMSIQVELWDTNQANLLVLPEGPVESNDLKTEFAQCSTPQSKVVGKLRSIKDQITYPAVAAVTDSNGKPIGYFVRWRRISPTANGRKQLADLLGNNAELYFGNVDGNFWTDLESVMTTPQPNLQSILEISHYGRDGHSVMGLGRPIKGTPWLVLLEFPDEVFLSPAKAFLRRMVFFGVILLTIGLLVALLLSRSITRPLHALTEAAAGISDGDYSRFVQIDTRDELGVLAKAFNLMTARVRDDVTERRKAEKALRHSEEHYRILFDSNPQPMWAYDIETYRFLDVNEAAIRHYGYSREEFLSMTIKDIRPVESISALLDYVNQHENQLGAFDEIKLWKHQRKDGRLIDVEVTSHRMRLSGHLARLVLAIDVTERRKAEAELQQKRDEVAGMTQQLWQASKLATMGELAASIAHELNNPLATVALRTEALMMRLPEGEPGRAPLEVISGEVDRMATLVTNLLQFSRRSHRQVSTVDVCEELSNSIEFVHYHLRNRKIAVAREFAGGVPTIQADRQQLRQLFLNLLTNAGDAMPQGGVITLRVGAARCRDKADAVIIEFADAGEGIAPDNLNKIWEPFFTTKPEGRGTGLGLAICRRIVEEHGGSIEIESEPAKGTSVLIKLPATSNGEATHLL